MLTCAVWHILFVFLLLPMRMTVYLCLCMLSEGLCQPPPHTHKAQLFCLYVCLMDFPEKKKDSWKQYLDRDRNLLPYCLHISDYTWCAKLSLCGGLAGVTLGQRGLITWFSFSLDSFCYFVYLTGLDVLPKTNKTFLNLNGRQFLFVCY